MRSSVKDCGIAVRWYTIVAIVMISCDAYMMRDLVADGATDAKLREDICRLLVAQHGKLVKDCQSPIFHRSCHELREGQHIWKIITEFSVYMTQEKRLEGQGIQRFAIHDQRQTDNITTIGYTCIFAPPSRSGAFKSLQTSCFPLACISFMLFERWGKIGVKRTQIAYMQRYII